MQFLIVFKIIKYVKRDQFYVGWCSQNKIDGCIKGITAKLVSTWLNEWSVVRCGGKYIGDIVKIFLFF